MKAQSPVPSVAKWQFVDVITLWQTVYKKLWLKFKITMLSMGKSTISVVIFNSKLFVTGSYRSIPGQVA